MKIQEIRSFDASQILPLYQSVGWTAYTDSPEALEKGFQNSLLILGAYEGNSLLGLIRIVGDGHTIVFIQDILVFPEHQRKGIGTKLLQSVLDRYPHVRQVQLATDNTHKTAAFYRSLGMAPYEEIGCRGFIRL